MICTIIVHANTNPPIEGESINIEVDESKITSMDELYSIKENAAFEYVMNTLEWSWKDA